jgi:hypothetical protein
LLTLLDDDDGHDHPVDTEDTSHDHWHHRLHDELGFEDTHRADAHAGLGATVRGSEIWVSTKGTGEDEGRSHSDEPEEVGVVSRHEI